MLDSYTEAPPLRRPESLESLERLPFFDASQTSFPTIYNTADTMRSLQDISMTFRKLQEFRSRYSTSFNRYRR